jgi:hypothetical protein
MRIDSSGNVLVGTTDTAITGRGTFAYNTNTTSNPTLLMRNGGGSAAFATFSDNGATTLFGWIVRSGAGVSYATASDYRLKENVAPMTGALDKVSALKPVTYKWKIDGSDGQGFIAHELQEVVPDAVTGEKDAVDEENNPQYQGIDTSFLVATLTAAIQEQQAMITELKATVDAQAARIAALEKK